MPRGSGPPVTQVERDRVADLHARGYGRNAIARELGRPGSVITKICQELDLTFDRSATRVAVQARQTEAAAVRSELQLQLLEDAQRLRAQIWSPHTYIDHGGKDFQRVEWEQDEPTPVDKLKLMQAAGAAIDRSIRLGEVDRGGEIDAARTMLGQLLEQLGVAAGDYDPAIAS